MKVAACQLPLLPAGSMGALDLIREQLERCVETGISVLCCPEAILGGLADFSDGPVSFAIRSHNGELLSVLTPLASDDVACIVGFTELGRDGLLYNAAAVFHRGRIEGIYRKSHPAIRQSAYSPGCETPVFRAGELVFGIVICNDSNYSYLAGRMAAQGASVLFIPTNNALPSERVDARLNSAARAADTALATQHCLWVIRADVAGQNGKLSSTGSSEIVDPTGKVVQAAHLGHHDLLVADIPVSNSNSEEL